MLVWRWSGVVDDGPALDRLCLDVLFPLGKCVCLQTRAAGMRCGTFPANTRHSCDMCSVGPTSSTLVRRGTGVVRFLLFLVGWPGVVLMFALFETSPPYFIYACVPTSGHTVLARSRFSVGPLSKTLAWYWTATGSVY